MDESSKQDELVQRCCELEASTSLWVAANQAKAERIEELELECQRLRQRVARLSRRAGRPHRATRMQKVRNVR